MPNSTPSGATPNTYLQRFKRWAGAWRRVSYSEHRLAELDARASAAESRLDQIERVVGIAPLEIPTWHVGSSLNLDTEARVEDAASGGLYQRFEDLYYPADLVTLSQSVYVPYVSRHVAAAPGCRVVDIGCGRGEFLTLLLEAGITGEGVEINHAEASALRQRGFSIHETDANGFLAEVPDASLGVVTMLQVVEHLTPDYFTELAGLLSRKLAPHALVIVETPNPACMEVVAGFYTDLTHVRPYPPETVRFYLAAVGLQESQIVYCGPMSRYPGTQFPERNYVAYGLIAWR